MKLSIEDQLHRYATDVVAELEPVTAAEAKAELRPDVSHPPTRRRGLMIATAAAAVTLVILGVGSLFTGGRGVDLVDSPISTSPSTLLPASTTASTPPGASEAGSFPDKWTRVAVEGSWPVRIIDVAALPGGGFVVVNSAPDSPTVVWSPDGFDWFDGDPLGLLPDQVGPVGRPDPNPPRSMAVVGDRVAILDWRMSVWIGDPSTGEWEEVPLEVEDGEGSEFAWRGWGDEGLAMASNGSQALVVGSQQMGTGDGLVMWLVDPLELSSVRVPTLSTPPLADGPRIQAGWFDGQWLMGANVMTDEPYTDFKGEEDVVRGMLWSSTDAVSWTDVDYGADWMGMLEQRGSHLIVHVPSLGGDRLWSTYDLVDWEVRWSLDDETDLFVPYYSEALGYFGFVDIDPSGPGEIWLTVSDDGRNWTPVGPSRYGDVLAVSGDRVLLSTLGDLWLLTSREPSPALEIAPTTAGPAEWFDLDEGTAEEIYSEVGQAWIDAFMSRDSAALAALYGNDAVHVDGFSGDEARGRDRIEAAFALHFDQMDYAALDLSGYSISSGGAVVDGKRLITVGVWWEWEAAPGDTSLYGVPPASRLLIDVDSRLVAWSTHPDPTG